jgi:hypothetical protein
MSEGLHIIGSKLYNNLIELSMIFEIEQKTQPITKLQITEAFRRVRANGGSAGVDNISIEQVDKNKRKYLYPL